MKKFLICLVLIFCITGTMFTQTYYTATDDDSITYVAATGKLLTLKRDSDNNLNLVRSVTISDLNYYSSAVSNDKLILTSRDTAYVFDISDRFNPVYIAKKYFGNIARGEKFGDNFVVVKRNAQGHAVIGISSDTIITYTALERTCYCWSQVDRTCSQLTFSYPYAFYLYNDNLLETWKYDEQTGLFYLLNLKDYTPDDWEQDAITSNESTVYLLLCGFIGYPNGYYYRRVYKMNIEGDTLIQTGVILQNDGPPTVGGDWETTAEFHRIVSLIFNINTARFDEPYSYKTNISLSYHYPLPKITDHHVYQCGNDFYYDYRITGDSIIFKKFTFPTSIDPVSQISVDYKLLQNYPNPFNPITTVSYAIGQQSFVTLTIYDVLGNKIATLVNEDKTAGSYKVKFDGSKLSSGIYFYKMEAGDYKEVRKLLLLK